MAHYGVVVATIVDKDAVVELLRQEYRALADVCGSLEPEQWDVPTSLPGWSVRDVGNGDLLVPYIFGETSADGSLATSFKETSVRVVCDNTAQIARFGGATHRTTHRSVWKAADARAAIENAVKDFGAYVEAARALARAKLDAAKVDELTAKLLADGDVEAAKAKRAFGKILELFNGSGAGSHLSTSNGTAWGWYNAVTDYVDHAARAQSDEHRFASAQSGPGAKMKDAALDIAMTTV